MTEQKILDNAPEGAMLTCTICEDKQRLYIDNLEMLTAGMATFWAVDGKEFDPESRYLSFNDDLQSLSDIKRIAELEKDCFIATDAAQDMCVEMEQAKRELEQLKAAQLEWISVVSEITNLGYDGEKVIKLLPEIIKHEQFSMSSRKIAFGSSWEFDSTLSKTLEKARLSAPPEK